MRRWRWDRSESPPPKAGGGLCPHEGPPVPSSSTRVPMSPDTTPVPGCPVTSPAATQSLAVPPQGSTLIPGCPLCPPSGGTLVTGCPHVPFSSLLSLGVPVSPDTTPVPGCPHVPPHHPCPWVSLCRPTPPLSLAVPVSPHTTPVPGCHPQQHPSLLVPCPQHHPSPWLSPDVPGVPRTHPGSISRRPGRRRR